MNTVAVSSVNSRIFYCMLLSGFSYLIMFVSWLRDPSMNLDITTIAEKQKGEPLKQQKLGKFGKDPNVETSFLPDRYCDCTFFPQLTIIC